MGKFDGPYFSCDEDLVSVWIAKCPYSKMPVDYFTENYDGEDEDTFNQFSTDFGFGYYDHDFVEGSALIGSASIEEIIKKASYGHSFAMEASDASDVKYSEHVFLMYNFNYSPSVTGITESKYYKFIGVFKFNQNA